MLANLLPKSLWVIRAFAVFLLIGFQRFYLVGIAHVDFFAKITAIVVKKECSDFLRVWELANLDRNFVFRGYI
jgi:hypothetical protein